jgi:hypothetical protein
LTAFVSAADDGMIDCHHPGFPAWLLLKGPQMRDIWICRLWGLGAGLLAVTLAALGLATVLSAAGDVIGRQAVFGVAAMTGLGFVIDLIVLTVCSARLETKPDRASADGRIPPSRSGLSMDEPLTFNL